MDAATIQAIAQIGSVPALVVLMAMMMDRGYKRIELAIRDGNAERAAEAVERRRDTSELAAGMVELRVRMAGDQQRPSMTVVKP